MDKPDRQFIWIIDGRIILGTFADYARYWEKSYYNGTPISTFVWTVHNSWELRMHKVNVYLKRVSNDQVQYTLTAFNTKYVRTVGRA